MPPAAAPNAASSGRAAAALAKKNPSKADGWYRCRFLSLLATLATLAAAQALKSLGFRSWRWHLSHSAVLRSLLFVKTSFIFTSPPQVQKNFCVTIPTLAFLLKTSAMFT
jgi:hypothetical protein